MMNLIALCVGAVVGWVPHLLFGDRLSLFADFLAGSVVGGAAYVIMAYKLKKLSGDL